MRTFTRRMPRDLELTRNGSFGRPAGGRAGRIEQDRPDQERDAECTMHAGNRNIGCKAYRLPQTTESVPSPTHRARSPRSGHQFSREQKLRAIFAPGVEE